MMRKRTLSFALALLMLVSMVPVAILASAGPPGSLLDPFYMELDGQILSITLPADPIMVNGKVYVPIRAIAEALGFTVHWDEAARMVVLNNFITFEPGKDYYTYARMAPIELGTAPVLTNGSTYVPLSFFTEVARVNNAYVFEGQVVVDTFEKME